MATRSFPATPVPGRFYITAEVCQLLRITDLTLAAWVKQGRAPKPLKVGRKNLYARAAIDALMEGKALNKRKSK